MPIPWIMQSMDTSRVDYRVIPTSEGITSDYPLPEHSTVPIEEAIRIVQNIAHKTGTETISVDDAEGRTLSETIYALADMPGFDRSSVNGFALITADTSDASAMNPCKLTLAGSVEKEVTHIDQINRGQAISILTGGILPEGADAVVGTEDCTIREGQIVISRKIWKNSNIIRKDEDFKTGEPLYPNGWVLRPQDIAVLASVGRIRVKVRRKPVIGIISTGRELVPAESIPKSGEVREVNSYLITAFCKRQDAIPVRYGIIRDDAEELTTLINQASQECDAIIVSGGSSRDEYDVTAQVIHTLGEVYTEGISFAPDKRTTIGRIGSILVIGLPGHPSATFMVLSLVVIHLIQAMKGSSRQKVYVRKAVLADHLHASSDSDRYIRVTITDDVATPLFGKAGLINMLSQSDGIVRIPAGSRGYRAGDRVEVMIW